MVAHLNILHLDSLAGTYISTDYEVTNSNNTITFGGTTPINIDEVGSISVLIEDDYANTQGRPSNNTFEDTITLDAICYVVGTDILCLIDGVEKYVKVENLEKGTLIKVYNQHKDEYVKAYNVSKSKIFPSRTHKQSKIFVLKKDRLGENKPYQDLYVTGGHSYLVDEIKDENIMRFMHNCNPEFGAAVHDKYKLLVSMSDEWEEYDSTEPTTIYHFALECDHEFGQYGVYANGILSESMSLFFFKKRKSK